MTSSVDMRPTGWDEYIGQDKLKADLQTWIDGVYRNDTMLPHVLLVAPPGVGKTTIAHLIADELGDELDEYLMPLPRNHFKYVLMAAENKIVFADEFHRLGKKEQHDLLIALEDGVWQDGFNRIELPPFTLIAATTEPQDLIKPMFRRFPIQPHFVDYTDAEMAQVVTLMAQRVNLEPTPEVATALGIASAGSPSQAERLVLAADAIGSIEDAQAVLSLANITPEGLTPQHIEYLNTLQRQHHPSGIDLLASCLNLPKPYVMDIERTLIKQGLIERTRTGRQLSPSGFQFITRRNNGQAHNPHQRSHPQLRTRPRQRKG